MSRRILVFGASGFLGSNVLLSLLGSGGSHEIIAHAATKTIHADVRVATADLRTPSTAKELVHRFEPNLVVNCAALADVDACERFPQRARDLNSTVPMEIALACAQVDSGFVHVSTDAVFAGAAGPYREEDAPSPLNVYGRTKADGERFVLTVLPSALIVRTNIIGWSPTGARSLLEYFHSNLSAGQQAPGYTDILFRPLPVQTFWPICKGLVDDGHCGMHHLTGPDLISKFDFGRLVAATFGFDERLVIPSSGRASGRTATRAPCLDVRPSKASFDHAAYPRSLAKGLEQLAELARSGMRVRLRELCGDQERQ